VTHYDDIVAITRQPELFSSSQATGPRSVTPTARRIADDASLPDEVRAVARRRVEIADSPILLFADPPLHNRQRKLVNRAFTPRRVRQMEDPIRGIANALVDDWHGAREIEFNEQFCFGLPLSVIADALGISRDLMDQFRAWSDAFTAGVGNPNMTTEENIAILQLVDEFYDYFTKQIADRRLHPEDDLLTDLVQGRLEGIDPLTEHEILQALSQFLVAGNETTAKLLCGAGLRLATDPELDAQLRSEPGLISAFVEELLRLETPAQGLFRTATEDTVIGEVDIPKGSLLFLAFAAGNRDPSFCPVPHELILERTLPSPHLAFGFGEHFCLGASLARAEARIGLETLLDRVTRFELIGDPDLIEYEPNFGLRGIKRLPLAVRYR
jgi:cytochrome P450